MDLQHIRSGSGQVATAAIRSQLEDHTYPPWCPIEVLQGVLFDVKVRSPVHLHVCISFSYRC